MAEKRQSAAAPITIAVVIIVALLLPVAYFLSFRPLIWLQKAGYINVNGKAGGWYARPLHRGAEVIPGVRTLFRSYLDLWFPPPEE